MLTPAFRPFKQVRDDNDDNDDDDNDDEEEQLLGHEKTATTPNSKVSPPKVSRRDLIELLLVVVIVAADTDTDAFAFELRIFLSVS